jgi:hypothetical protein
MAKRTALQKTANKAKRPDNTDDDALVPAVVIAEIETREEAAKREQKQFIEMQLRELGKLRRTVSDIDRQYQDLLYKQLQKTYGVFLQIEQSEHAESLYNEIRNGLQSKGIKVRSDTTNAACIVRLVFPNLKPKSVYDYGTVMLEAQRCRVDAEQLSAWLKQQTMTKLIASYKENKDEDIDSYKSRMQRARIIVLRAMTSWETQKYITKIGPVPMHEAEKNLQYETNTTFLLANAVRRTDRESFYADYYVYRILPSNYDFFIFFVNHLAKEVQPNIDYWEMKMDELEEKQWQDELWTYLQGMELSEMAATQAKKKAKRAAAAEPKPSKAGRTLLK